VATTTDEPSSSAPAAAAGTSDTTRPQTTTTAVKATGFKIGEKVTYNSGVSVQVFTYEQGVPSSNQFSKPGAGNEFAVLDVEVCSSASTEIAYNTLGFAAQTADNRRYENSFGITRSPALGAGTLPAGSGCKRGWVTVEVPVGQRPVFIVWNYSSLAEAKWTL
jgi:hypothetical protein